MGPTSAAGSTPRPNVLPLAGLELGGNPVRVSRRAHLAVQLMRFTQQLPRSILISAQSRQHRSCFADPRRQRDGVRAQGQGIGRIQQLVDPLGVGPLEVRAAQSEYGQRTDLDVLPVALSGVLDRRSGRVARRLKVPRAE
jgi:hypothetical protein